MHPINIKSKIPNPKLIRPQTSPSKRVEQLPSTFIGNLLQLQVILKGLFISKII